MTPAQIKAVASLVLLVGLCGLSAWAGWEWRDRSCDLAVAQQQLQQSEANTEAVVEARKDDQGAQANAATVEAERVEAQAEANTEFKIIYRDVVRYVQANPDPAGCDLGPDGLRAWRAANAGRSDRAEPVDPARADGAGAEDASPARRR